MKLTIENPSKINPSEARKLARMLFRGGQITIEPLTEPTPKKNQRESIPAALRRKHGASDAGYSR